MSEIQILTATHGIAPRSDELLRIGGDVERGRLEQSVFDNKLAQEAEDWLGLQTEAGIDIQENGKLAWQDHLRPIIKASNGFATDIDDAPITRWGNTNTFYRKPTIIGPLSFDGKLLQAEIGKPGDHISLLAPFSFASLCEDKYEDLQATTNVLGLYSDLINYLESEGVERITFTEVVERGFIEGVSEPSRDYVTALARSAPNVSFGYINSSSGSVVLSHDFPRNLGSHVGEHTLQTFAQIPPPLRPIDLSGSEVWRSVIDSSTTAPDSTNPEANWIRGIQRIQPGKIVLTHTTDLQYLPLPHAREKIKRLADAKEQLTTALGEQR